MIVPSPLRLIGIGLVNETYQGPSVNLSDPGGAWSVDSTISQYLEDGAHLRWRFQRRLEWPKYGFKLYRRSSASSPNYVQLSYFSDTSTPQWKLGSSSGTGASASVTPIGTDSFLLTFNPSQAAAIIGYATTSGAVAPAGSVTAYGLTNQSVGYIANSPTARNLGDVSATYEDVVVVVPDMVDLGSVYSPLGNALAAALGKSDPFYGAYLAGLYDDDNDNDENFGAGDSDSDDADVSIAQLHDGGTHALDAGPAPWLDGLQIRADPSVISALNIEFVSTVATRLQNPVNSGDTTAIPVSMANIWPGVILKIDTASTSAEQVTVLSTTSTTFTTTSGFQFSHPAGAPIGDLPAYNNWAAEGWTLVATLPFPSSQSQAVARVLASTYPSSWDQADSSGQTTANGIKQLYSTLYNQLASTLGDGTTINPNSTPQFDQVNPTPGQDLGSVSLGALDTLLALSIDHYIARMWGLAFCDPLTSASAHIVVSRAPSYDYLVAGFWTQDPSAGGVPDYYAPTFRVYKDQHKPLASPANVSGAGILQSYQPVDNVTTFSATTGAIPGIGLNWDLLIDPNGPDLGMEVGAPAAFDVYRAHDSSGSPSDAFIKVNTQPVVVPRGPDAVNGGSKLPQYCYVDIGPDAKSPGGFDLLSGPYDYEVVAIDLFGRISPASAVAGPFTPLVLPPPPPPVAVSARYLDPKDPFLSSAEKSKVSAASGSTADVTWHWTGSLRQGFLADHFNVYYRDSLPAPMAATLSTNVFSTSTHFSLLPPGQFRANVTPAPSNLGALVGGAVLQGAYQRVIENLGGPIIPHGITARIPSKQWLIVSAVTDNAGGANLVLQRTQDRDGSLNAETDGDIPANGACQLTYNLGDRSLWTQVPSGTLSAGTLPPPPASQLLLDAAAGTTTLVVESPGELATNTAIVVGTDVVTVSSAIAQAVSLTTGIAHAWPKGTPVSVLVSSSAISPGATSLALNAVTGVVPGQAIVVGLVRNGAGTTTTIPGSVSAGTQTVTPADMTNIYIGTQVQIDAGANTETVVVTAITSTTFTAKFAKSHSAGAAVLVVDATERVLVTNVSSKTLTVSPALQVPWPTSTPVSVVDVPYDLAPSHSTFATLGMLPTGTQVTSGGYFAVSTVAVSPQDGSKVEGPVSAPARITTVSYTPHVAPTAPTSQPPCSQLTRVLTDAADVHGVSRAKVPLPTPPAGAPAYVEIWRASDEAIFDATGQVLPLADSCANNWALMQLANASIDRAAPPPATPTTLSAAAAAGATSVQLTSTTGAQDYRKLVFLDANGHYLETVTIAGGYGGSGNPVPIFPALANSYSSGQPVQVVSQGMGPFTLVKKDPIPWTPGTTFVDDTLHGLSDNVYFYTFVSVPVQTQGNTAISDPTHQVQGAGARSLAWPVTAPYQIKPTRPPLAPASIAATPGSTPGSYNQIQLAWTYDLPSGQQLLTPPNRVYTIYRTTDPSKTGDIRLMPVLKQLTFTPANTTIGSAVSAGIQTVTPASMAGIAPGATLAVFDVVGGATIQNLDIVIVQSTTATGFKANFAHAHPAGAHVVGGLASFLDGVTNGVTDWSLMGNQDYYYRITGADSHGNVSPPSNVVHTRAIEQLPPLVPTNLRARWVLDSATGKFKVVLTWTNPRPDLQMQLQRMDSGGIFWKTVWPRIAGVWSAANASSAADLTADYYHGRKRYQYRLVVRTASGYTNFSNVTRA